MNTKLKQIVAAVGLALALSPAMAALTWRPAPQSTLFEDNSLDFALTVQTDINGEKPADPADWVLIPDTNTTLNVGDVLIAVVEFETSRGISILPQELTGVSVIQFSGINADGFLEFAPYEGGLNAAAGVSVTGGGVGEGAMLALWLDNDPDLDISAGLVPDSLSCATRGECITQATNGTIWEVDGFVAGQNNYWTAFGTGTDFSAILAAGTGSGFGQYNAGLDILQNNTGQNLALNSYPGLAVAQGGNGGLPVDIIVTGNILGGGATDAISKASLQSLIDTGYVATDDADLEKRVAVPEPGILALLGVGLLGLGFRRRQA